MPVLHVHVLGIGLLRKVADDPAHCSGELASRLLDTAGSEQARKDDKAQADRYRDYKHVPRRLRMNVWTCTRASIRLKKFVIAVDGMHDGLDIGRSV